ncbi:MAG TPA: protoporphyrinogen oxidase [Acidisarcina sp.]
MSGALASEGQRPRNSDVGPQRIAIIGGGISGLAVAYELQRLQSESPSAFVLFEATHRLGGIVETVKRDGFVIECGPDAWVTEKPWARELAIELGLESEILPSNDAQRRTLILQKGELIPMPDGMRMMVPSDLAAIDTSSLFTDEARRAYRSEPVRADKLKSSAPPPSPEGDESIATFVRRHFGEEVTSKIAAPLLSGVFGGDIERLSVRSVMPAFVKMEREHGSLILALQHRTAASATKDQLATKNQPTIFTTLASGLGTLIDAIAATLPPSAIRLLEPVNSIQIDEGNWEVTSAKGTQSFDEVVLATPAHITGQLLTPLDKRFGELLNIDASSAIVVAFAFRPEHASKLRIPQGFGFLAPQTPNASSAQASIDGTTVNEPSTLEPSLLACTFVDQKFRHRVPTDAKLLRAFYGGDAALALLTETDESLIVRARRQLAAILKIPEPAFNPAFTLVRRWPKSLPQYEVGHEARVSEIENLAATIPGLHLAGNTWHGVGLPDLIRDGRATARKTVDPK